MSEKYNALDNQQTAQQLIGKLQLELHDLEMTISYEEYMENHDHWNPNTEDYDDFEPEITDTDRFAAKVRNLLQALREYLPVAVDTTP